MTSTALQTLYQQVIVEQAKERVGFGLIESPSGASHQVNPTCGDEITMQASLSADGSTLDSVHWEGNGCTISMASASLLSDIAADVSLETVQRLIGEFREVMRSRGQLSLDDEAFGDAVALEGVSKYIARVKCAMLGWVALEDALVKAQTPATAQA